MTTKKIIVRKESGLHARPGSDLVNLAMTFISDIHLIKGDKKVNAKEVLEILSADINFNDEITIEVNGEDEKEALKTLEEYITK